MAHTDGVHLIELFASMNEAAAGQFIRHVMRQRPSLFNYGTDFFKQHPDKLPAPITPDPLVAKYGAPLLTVQQPLALPGTAGHYALHYCAQITAAQLDFSPSNVFSLPAGFGPSLADQRLALHAGVCIGIGFPSDTGLAALQPAPVPAPAAPAGPTVLPADTITSFNADAFLVAHVELAGPPGGESLRLRLDNVGTSGLFASGVEGEVEALAKLLFQLVILPKATAALSRLVVQTTLPIAGITLKISRSPTVPAPQAALQFNPAIEDDQLKAYAHLEVH